MARAETVESVGETAAGGNGPSPSHPHLAQTSPHYCHHHWLWDWYRSGTGNHHLQPLQALYLSYPLPYPHPEDSQDEPQTHQQQLPASLPSPPPPPPSPLCNRGDVRGGGGPTAPRALSGDPSDSDREQHPEASSGQGPLPDLLHQIEPPLWPPPPHREALQELEVRRLGSQLRAIGDEFNSTILRRAHAAPQWHDWRDACRGLFNLIAQTLSTLYRLT